MIDTRQLIGKVVLEGPVGKKHLAEFSISDRGVECAWSPDVPAEEFADPAFMSQYLELRTAFMLQLAMRLGCDRVSVDNGVAQAVRQ